VAVADYKSAAFKELFLCTPINPIAKHNFEIYLGALVRFTTGLA
jgi:hypothetical protein